MRRPLRSSLRMQSWFRSWRRVLVAFTWPVLMTVDITWPELYGTPVDSDFPRRSPCPGASCCGLAAVYNDDLWVGDDLGDALGLVDRAVTNRGVIRGQRVELCGDPIVDPR